MSTLMKILVRNCLNRTGDDTHTIFWFNLTHKHRHAILTNIYFYRGLNIFCAMIIITNIFNLLLSSILLHR